MALSLMKSCPLVHNNCESCGKRMPIKQTIEWYIQHNNSEESLHAI